MHNAGFKLHQTSKQYTMKISTIKTKLMAFRGKERIRTKIMISDRILEQVSHFNYLDISYDRNYNIDVKLCKFQTICGPINRIFRNKIRRDTKLKLYEVIAVPELSYGCEPCE